MRSESRAKNIMGGLGVEVDFKDPIILLMSQQ